LSEHVLNSCFGALASKYYRYNNSYIAESITTAGQVGIQWTMRKTNEYLNLILKTDDVDYTVGADTDSEYVELNQLVMRYFKDKPNATDHDKVEFLDLFCKTQLDPAIQKSCIEMKDYMNARLNKLDMEREAISSRGFFTAKKRYALLVHDMEGVRYAKPKLKIMGLETQKSSTPKPCRDLLKDMIMVMLTKGETETQEFIENAHDDFIALDIGEYAVPRGINGLEKYCIENGKAINGTPAHAKAALVYNMMIKRKNLPLDPIKSGDKLKYVPLKEPNPCGFPIVGFPSHLGLPKEFGLDEYVDVETVYYKAFLKPAEAMLGAVGWNVEKTSSLEDFF